ncbi:MAG: TspO/MBR family protein [Pseudomonadota bacterium]
MQKQLFGLMAWLAICFIASALGATASINAESFYNELTQPSWAPPAWLFGPVWTILYIMMAISAWLVWRTVGFRANSAALTLFLAQLALNTLWSWLFFAWQYGSLSFLDIIVLWVLILLTIIHFWRVSSLAGLLLIPYWLWVSFAMVLNFTIWQLNPELLS